MRPEEGSREQGYQQLRGRRSDAFVTRLSADGASLVYSGFFGGSDGDGDGERANGIALLGPHSFYIAGLTSSPDLPVAVGPDLTFNGVTDAFVTKFRDIAVSNVASQRAANR